MSPRLALHLLGPPKLEIDGSPITADRRKVIALLAYLVLDRRRHTRDFLSALLWPNMIKRKPSRICAMYCGKPRGAAAVPVLALLAPGCAGDTSGADASSSGADATATGATDPTSGAGDTTAATTTDADASTAETAHTSDMSTGDGALPGPWDEGWPIPYTPQIPGDPKAGYDAMLNKGYVTCGVPYDFFGLAKGFLGDFTRGDPLPGRTGNDPQNPYNRTFEGKSYSQAPCAEQKLPNSVFWSFDPKHEHAKIVRKQMGSLTMPTMAGFVEDAIGELRKHYDPRRIAEQVMGYFPVLDGTSPTGAIHELARHFTICDHWFSSVPGPTWVNRFFALCGTAEGHLAMPDFSWTGIRRFHPYGMDTIFGRLRAKGRSARIFQDGVPGLTMLLSDVLRDPGLFGGMDEFELLAGQGEQVPGVRVYRTGFLLTGAKRSASAFRRRGGRRIDCAGVQRTSWQHGTVGLDAVCRDL